MSVRASRPSLRCVCLLAAGLLAGCGGGSSTPTQPAASVIAFRITTPASTLRPGTALPITSVETLSDGRTVTTGFDVRWASSDETVATVNAGLVTAKAEGIAVITATAAGIAASVAIRVHVPSAGPYLIGFVTQTGKEEPVIGARVAVVDGVSQGQTGLSDPFGRFVLDVIGVVKLRVSAPYFEDTEVTVDASSPAVIRLAPVQGMIIDAIGFLPSASPGQLTFSQRSTGLAHLTVKAVMSDTLGFETWCGELRDDENRLLWRTTSRENGGYEATTTATLTGAKNYTLKVYDCTPTGRSGMGLHVLKAEHM